MQQQFRVRVFSFLAIFSLLFSSIGISTQNVLAAPGCSGIVYVNANATGGNPNGCSWGTAFSKLQDALAAASSGDQIWVAVGTYYPDEGSGQSNNDRSCTFLLKNGVSIYGGFSGSETLLSQRNSDPATNNTFLSGDIDGTPNNIDLNAFHVVTADRLSSNVVLDGFTITGANSTGAGNFEHGAGIVVYDSSPTFSNLILRNNTSAATGAGMYIVTYDFTLPEASYVRPSLTNLTIRDNTSIEGAGLSVQNASPVLNNVVFTGNTATGGAGGGMYANTFTATDAPSVPKLTNVTFSNNNARGGAGLFNNNSNTLLNNVTFSNNTSRRRGGAILNESASPTLTNVTFYGNTSTETESSAPWGGGAIMNITSNLTLNNVTFSGNNSVNASGTAGGDAIRNVSGSNAVIRNSIFWGDGNTNDEINSDGTGTITISDSVVQGGFAGGTHIITTNPNLSAPSNNGGFTQTMAIDTGSSALDTGGVNSACATTDQRGVTRPQGAVCDIGAFELDNGTQSAVADAYSATEDVVLSVAAPGVLANDVNANTFTAIKVSDPSHGTLTLNADGSFAYTPNSNYNGNDSFTYKANNGSSDSNTATVSITVNPVNDAPVAVADSFAVMQDQQLIVSAPGLLGNDTDVDGNPLAAIKVTDPAHGGLTLNANGSFIYTPNTGYSGNDSFTYKASDSALESNIVTVTITVNPGNLGCSGILYVNASANSVGANGCSWSTAYPKLQDALAVAASGNQIWVAAGTYYPDEGTGQTNNARTTTFLLKGNVSVYGGFTGNETLLSQRNSSPATNNTILSGDIDGTPADISANAFNVVTANFSSANAALDGFTITGGNATGNGAGLIISDSSPAFSNLIIRNNAASFGGGIYNYTTNTTVSEASYSHPTFSNVTLSNNTAIEGGGILATNSSMVLNNVVFSGNTASSGAGGGMYAETANSTDAPSAPKLTNVTFNNNTARGGAGMYNGNSNGILNSVTFSNNTALRRGGGVLNENASPSFTNVTFYGNVSQESIGGTPWGGGGMINVTSNPILNNVTFSGNNSLNASGTAGGDAMRNTVNSNPIIRNSIFWGDTNDEINSDGSGTITISDTVVQGGFAGGTNIKTTSPNLDPGGLASNGGLTQTIAIVSSPSSALDAGGVTTACAPADQRGVARPQGAACDIGAFELQNTALTAGNDTYSVDEDVALSVAVPGVLVNDTGSGSLTAIKVTDPTNGTLTLNANGSFTYIPNPNFNGSDSFSYKANNGSSDSNTATVLITVGAVNDVPVCSPHSLTTSEDTAGSVTLVCTDVDNSTLTYSIVTQPASGLATLNGNLLTYTPNANFFGFDTVSFKANDGALDSAVSTVNISVTSANDAPVCQNVNINTNEDVTGETLVSCSDVDSALLTYAIITQPAHGTAQISGSTLRYIPNTDYNGSDSFSYRASDAQLNGNAAAVNVTVNPVNDAPVLASIGNKSVVAGSLLSFTATASDIDTGNTLTFSLNNAPSGAGITSNGVFSWTPTQSQGPNTYTFDVCVSDGIASDCETIAVTVLALPGSFNKTSPSNGSTGYTGSTLTLSWGTSSGATSYEYCVDTTNNNSCDGSWISTGTTTNVLISGLMSGQQYYWHVRAGNTAGYTYANANTWWSFATLAGSFNKTSPATGTTGQPLNPSLSWGTSSGATSYEYCIDTTNNNTCDVSWITTGTNQTVTLSGLSASTTYYWQIRSLFAGSYSYANSNTWWSFTTLALPAAFNKTSPTNGLSGNGTSLTLSWGTSSGATSYEYCMDTTNNSSCDGSWVSTGTATSVTVSGLGSGLQYYWQVRARNGAGTTNANAGTWWSFATLPGSFAKTSPATGATGQSLSPTLSWGTSSGATSYEYCIDTTNNSSCDGSWISTAGNRTLTLSGLLANTTYYWQVRSVFAGSYSYANSNTWWSFRTLSLPAAFNKTSPTNALTGLGTSLTLSWGASSGATSYEYCVDTSNNNTCNGSWISTGTTTSVTISGLTRAQQYYWQVRARNAAGTTNANAGTWWSFTTRR